MKDAAHEVEATQIDVAGYRSCRNPWCGELILVEVASHTGGLCAECLHGELGSKLAEVEVRNRGRIQSLRLPQRRGRDKGNLATHTAGTKARSRADRRLRNLFPELYEVLLGEERARLGLEPFPIQTAIHQASETELSQTLDFARVYDALDEHGVDVDATDAE